VTILTVTHKTIYDYSQPVTFGEHRMMFRPRDSHDLRLLDTSLVISPRANVRWLHDVFGNSVAIANFVAPAQQLAVTSTIRAKHYPLPRQSVTLEGYAERYPFSYSAQEAADLGRTAERHYPDPLHSVDLWAREFVDAEPERRTMGILDAMTTAIHDGFTYNRRPEMGTQEPAKTLATRSGTCRDYALLMMEAARSLGLAARFVTGYLYDEKLITEASQGLLGGGETHAWVQIYLPGAGWVEFDPTNALIGGKNLIRVGVVRDPSQAIPLAGSFTGPPNAFLGMNVDVQVSAEPDEGVGPAPVSTQPAPMPPPEQQPAPPITSPQPPPQNTGAQNAPSPSGAAATEKPPLTPAPA
jgi:transglutaminase-like putative cysteine protease